MRKRWLIAAACVTGVCLSIWPLQRYWAHRGGRHDGPEVACQPLLGWFTREDRRSEPGPMPPDLQPGDILITLSTHSLGWRHGHAGLVIDENRVLECAVLGEDSCISAPEDWLTYSGYAVLRVRGAGEGLGQQAADYAMEHLLGVPYRLTAGLGTDKAPGADSPGFGMHCFYLPWYAWYAQGIDLDGDGGRLVTASDLLASPLLEVVWGYGMEFG